LSAILQAESAIQTPATEANHQNHKDRKATFAFTFDVFEVSVVHSFWNSEMGYAPAGVLPASPANDGKWAV
jgi:hypothetical protein